MGYNTTAKLVYGVELDFDTQAVCDFYYGMRHGETDVKFHGAYDGRGDDPRGVFGISVSAVKDCGVAGVSLEVVGAAVNDQRIREEAQKLGLSLPDGPFRWMLVQETS